MQVVRCEGERQCGRYTGLRVSYSASDSHPALTLPTPAWRLATGVSWARCGTWCCSDVEGSTEDSGTIVAAAATTALRL